MLNRVVPLTAAAAAAPDPPPLKLKPISKSSKFTTAASTTNSVAKRDGALRCPPAPLDIERKRRGRVFIAVLSSVPFALCLILACPFCLCFLILRLVGRVVGFFGALFAQLSLTIFVKFIYFFRVGSLHSTLLRCINGGHPHSRLARTDVVVQGSLQSVSIHSIPCLADNYAYLLVAEPVLAPTPLFLERPAMGGSGDAIPAVLVDASESDAILSAMSVLSQTHFGGRELNLLAIFTTHHHWDHQSGNQKLKKAFPKLRIFGSHNDCVDGVTDYVCEGNIIPLFSHEISSDGTPAFEVMESPCHTSGSLMYRLRCVGGWDCLFTGDTFFLGGCGNPFELPRESMAPIFWRIERELHPLSLIFPGHEYTLKILSELLCTTEMAATGLNPEGLPTPFFALCSALFRAAHLRRVCKPPAPTVPFQLAQELLYNPNFIPAKRAAQALARAARSHVRLQDRVLKSYSRLTRKEGGGVPPETLMLAALRAAAETRRPSLTNKTSDLKRANDFPTARTEAPDPESLFPGGLPHDGETDDSTTPDPLTFTNAEPSTRGHPHLRPRRRRLKSCVFLDNGARAEAESPPFPSSLGGSATPDPIAPLPRSNDETTTLENSSVQLVPRFQLLFKSTHPQSLEPPFTFHQAIPFESNQLPTHRTSDRSNDDEQLSLGLIRSSQDEAPDSLVGPLVDVCPLLRSIKEPDAALTSNSLHLISERAFPWVLPAASCGSPFVTLWRSDLLEISSQLERLPPPQAVTMMKKKLSRFLRQNYLDESTILETKKRRPHVSTVKQTSSQERTRSTTLPTTEETRNSSQHSSAGDNSSMESSLFEEIASPAPVRGQLLDMSGIEICVPTTPVPPKQEQPLVSAAGPAFASLHDYLQVLLPPPTTRPDSTELLAQNDSVPPSIAPPQQQQQSQPQFPSEPQHSVHRDSRPPFSRSKLIEYLEVLVDPPETSSKLCKKSFWNCFRTASSLGTQSPPIARSNLLTLLARHGGSGAGDVAARLWTFLSHRLSQSTRSRVPGNPGEDETSQAAKFPLDFLADELSERGRLALEAELSYFERLRRSGVGGPVEREQKSSQWRCPSLSNWTRSRRAKKVTSRPPAHGSELPTLPAPADSKGSRPLSGTVRRKPRHKTKSRRLSLMHDPVRCRVCRVKATLMRFNIGSSEGCRDSRV